VYALAIHGTVILLIGFLEGSAYSLAIMANSPPDVVQQWRIAHLGSISGGLLLLAGSYIATLVAAPDGLWLTRVYVLGGYAFATAMLLAAVFGQRGLSPHLPPTNLIVHILYVVGSIAVLLGTAFATWSLRKAARAARVESAAIASCRRPEADQASLCVTAPARETD
jgi:hypothetical protein